MHTQSQVLSHLVAQTFQILLKCSEKLNLADALQGVLVLWEQSLYISQLPS
jgi:glycyl-tRNA synthetase alpha subunit